MSTNSSTLLNLAMTIQYLPAFESILLRLSNPLVEQLVFLLEDGTEARRRLIVLALDGELEVRLA
jgi:hypothetical protein